MKKSIATRVRIENRQMAREKCDRSTSDGRAAFCNLLRGIMTQTDERHIKRGAADGRK